MFWLLQVKENNLTCQNHVGKNAHPYCDLNTFLLNSIPMKMQIVLLKRGTRIEQEEWFFHLNHIGSLSKIVYPVDLPQVRFK